MSYLRAVPKPVKREKERKPLRRGKPIGPATFEEARAQRRDLQARRRAKPARKTKHARRDRELGRMLFYSTLWCILRDMARSGNIEPSRIDAAMACDGPIEVAHLGPRAGWRRCGDGKTAPLCRKHHREIDGKIGGRGPWFVSLGRERQLEIREKLTDFADNYWRMLTPAEQQGWDDKAVAQRAA